MQTLLLKGNQIDEAGAILRKGGLVAIPTETVYGLAANALDGSTVAKIFEAKGRPQDNPLIVHIADISEIDDLVAYVPPVLYDLADAFWPGPLTIILDKSDAVPDEVTAGLDTVAIRMPSHPVARKIIRAAGVPLAAPSANASGKPSPTTAAHVIKDMDGKIDAIVDGGPCEVGVESTVITLAARKPRLLRPGRITPEEIEEVIGDELVIDDAVLGRLKEGEKAASPGMKYKHYSPSADVIIVKGTLENFAKFVNERAGEGVAALVFDGEEDKIECKAKNFGEENDDLAHAAKLFDALRACDDEGVSTLYVRCPGDEGVGLAVMNRLLRAADFKIEEV
ncbi:MAG: threonylcarbamoyl-AMP synthase [Clostridiales bacterium]|nr:threonylcarbamoyl-AMP synthase [Clostridiales bacterium]